MVFLFKFKWFTFYNSRGHTQTFITWPQLQAGVINYTMNTSFLSGPALGLRSDQGFWFWFDISGYLWTSNISVVCQKSNSQKRIIFSHVPNQFSRLRYRVKHTFPKTTKKEFSQGEHSTGILGVFTSVPPDDRRNAGPLLP